MVYMNNSLFFWLLLTFAYLASTAVALKRLFTLCAPVLTAIRELSSPDIVVITSARHTKRSMFIHAITRAKPTLSPVLNISFMDGIFFTTPLAINGHIVGRVNTGIGMFRQAVICRTTSTTEFRVPISPRRELLTTPFTWFSNAVGIIGSYNTSVLTFALLRTSLRSFVGVNVKRSSADYTRSMLNTLSEITKTALRTKGDIRMFLVGKFNTTLRTYLRGHINLPRKVNHAFGVGNWRGTQSGHEGNYSPLAHVLIIPQSDLIRC